MTLRRHIAGTASLAVALVVLIVAIGVYDLAFGLNNFYGVLCPAAAVFGS